MTASLISMMPILDAPLISRCASGSSVSGYDLSSIDFSSFAPSDWKASGSLVSGYDLSNINFDLLDSIPPITPMGAFASSSPKSRLWETVFDDGSPRYGLKELELTEVKPSSWKASGTLESLLPIQSITPMGAFASSSLESKFDFSKISLDSDTYDPIDFATKTHESKPWFEKKDGTDSYVSSFKPIEIDPIQSLRDSISNLTKEKDPMTFIDLPQSGFQAHCHEGSSGTAHFKSYSQKKIDGLSSYEFAIGDLYAKRMGLKTWGKDID